MSTSKEFHEYVMEQLISIGASSRAMMGEYVLYYKDKVVGGIYDNRILVKPVKSATEILKNAPLEIPYAGVKPMLLVEDFENKEFMLKLFEAMYAELPLPAKKKR